METWKVQLIIANNMISSGGINEEYVTYSKSGNIEITIKDERDDIIEELWICLWLYSFIVL